MLLGVSHNSQISGVIVECNEMNDLGLFQFMKLETCYFQKFKHLWPNSWCKKPKFDLIFYWVEFTGKLNPIFES